MKDQVNDVSTISTAPCAAGRTIAGDLNGQGRSVCITASRFNSEMTDALLTACTARLQELGVAERDITVIRVPGAYEIPAAMDYYLKQHRPDACIALGVVIQGETPHAELINNYVGHALGECSIRHNVPVIDTVVCTYTVEQAEKRTMNPEHCRGLYAASTAVEMCNVFQSMKESTTST